MSKRQRIKDLEKQLNEDYIEDYSWTEIGTLFTHKEPTIKAKVDAIIKHLGLNLEMVDKKCVPAHVVARKKKAKK